MNIPENNFKEIEHVHGIFLGKEVQIIRRGQAEIAQYAHEVDDLSHWMGFWEFVEKQFVAEFG